jgi:ABC-type metal ion transport system substrate-binding protein
VTRPCTAHAHELGDHVHLHRRPHQGVRHDACDGNYFLDAGYTLKDALIVESIDDNPYANFLASRQDNADNPDIVRLNELLHSDAAKKFIEDRWPGGDVTPAF